MYLQYGTYRFDDNAALATSASELLLNKGGQLYERRDTISVSGYLAGTGQADLTQKASALASALAKPYQDLILYQDGGAPTQTLLPDAGSITGVTVKGPDFGTAAGPEYATIRTYSFTASASYPAANSKGMLLSFQETLAFSGGGPLYAHRLAINGPPQKQMIYPATVYRVVQSGSCEGYGLAPPPPAPKWPAALSRAPQIKRTSPERRGQGYSGFGLTWEYEFESAVPLVGAPNFWLK